MALSPATGFAYPHYRPPRVRKVVKESIPQDAAALLAQKLASAVNGTLMDRSDVAPGTRSLLVWMASHAHHVISVRDVVKLLQLGPMSSITSWFQRAGAPSLKTILREYRLSILAGLAATNPKVTVGCIAYALGFSSPQSLGRHLRQYRGARGLTKWRREVSLWTEWPRVRSILNHPALAKLTDKLQVGAAA